MDKNTCEKCCFYDGTNYGKCRKYPPVVLLVQSTGDFGLITEPDTYWPVVGKNEVCGEFQSE